MKGNPKPTFPAGSVLGERGHGAPGDVARPDRLSLPQVAAEVHVARRARLENTSQNLNAHIRGLFMKQPILFIRANNSLVR